MMRYVNYEPGNGTRYMVLFVQVDDPKIAEELCIDPEGWVVSLMNFQRTVAIANDTIGTVRPVKGTCYAFQPESFRPDGVLDAEYVQKKFKLNYFADAEAMTQLIGHVLIRKVAKEWPKCPKCSLPMVPGRDQCVSCECSLELHK